MSVFDAERGEGRLLIADLDVGQAIALGLSRAAAVNLVAAEAEALIELVERCGGHAVCDLSPSGGRHIYVLFGRPLPWTELRQLARALAVRFKTMDVRPMSSAKGQIRPPGSLHKVSSGQLTGYLHLTIPVEQAERILRRPCGKAVWQALHQDLTAELAAVTGRPARTAAALHDGAIGDGVTAAAADGRTCSRCGTLIEIPLDGQGRPWLPRLGGRRVLPAAMDELARTGNWRLRGAPSASESRLGLLNSITAAGWTYGEMLTQMRQGSWTGIAGLLEKKRLSDRMTRLARDWRKAVLGVAWQRHIAKCNTSARTTSTPPGPTPAAPDALGLAEVRTLRDVLYVVDSDQGGSAPAGFTAQEELREANLWSVRTATPEEADQRILNHWQQIRQWRTCIWLAERDEERVRGWGRAAPAIRLLLRAIAVAARMDGSVQPAFGCRSLSEMTGLDYTVVSRHLRRLREEDDPLIDLIEAASGRRADRYGLLVPEAYRVEARWIRWRAGGIDALHPALHALGPVTGLVYEALTSTSTGSTELARLALLSLSATSAALRTLAAYQLAVRDSWGWRRGERSLAAAAVELGADVIKTERHALYRAHRRAWWDLLEAWELPPVDRPVHLQARVRSQTQDLVDVVGAAEADMPWPEEPLDDGTSDAWDHRHWSGPAGTGKHSFGDQLEVKPSEVFSSRSHTVGQQARIWPQAIPGRRRRSADDQSVALPLFVLPVPRSPSDDPSLGLPGL
ncbi:hypothetical protein ACQPYK_49350 (plasmid) [Streptosporangium sp. CA-135522]|uniref:hypothetical protein n=1 Tax=Streptosporangium sp. CA-135522 TaxID=3240072 RepID=UPI003D89D11A